MTASDVATGRDSPRTGGPWAVLALVAFALALRLAIAARLPLVEVDGAYWGALAAALRRGDWTHGLSASWPWLYPAVTALASLAPDGGASPAAIEWAARTVSAVAGALLLLPLAAIAARLLPPRAAWTVLLLAAVHPRLVEYSAAALSESLYTLLVTCGVAAVVRADVSGPGAPWRVRAWQATGGAAFGASFLARPEALPLGGLVWLAGLTRPAPHGRPRRIAFLLLMLGVALPWLVFLRVETGRWTLGEKSTYNFWRAHRVEYAKHFSPPTALPARVNRSPELAPAADPGEVRLGQLLAREPAAVTLGALRRLGESLASSLPVAVGWPVALLAVAGLWGARRGPWWPVFATLAAVPIMVAPFSADRRFFVPLVPMAILLAAAALERWSPRAGRGAPVVALALAAGLFAYALGIPSRADRAPGHRAAGEWLATHAPGGTRPVVMARKPWVAFYSGGLIADLPDAPADSILADAARTGVTVLVADARAARSDRPQLAPWLAPGGAPAGWRELARWNAPDTLVLFRRERAGS